MAWMYETQKHIVNMKRSAKADLMTSQHKIRGLSQVVEAVCFYFFFKKAKHCRTLGRTTFLSFTCPYCVIHLQVMQIFVLWLYLVLN